MVDVVAEDPKARRTEGRWTCAFNVRTGGFVGRASEPPHSTYRHADPAIAPYGNADRRSVISCMGTSGFDGQDPCCGPRQDCQWDGPRYTIERGPCDDTGEPPRLVRREV